MEAMITTVGGLIVGIVAYVAYNYLVSKVDKVIHNMEGASIEFIDILEAPGKIMGFKSGNKIKIEGECLQ